MRTEKLVHQKGSNRALQPVPLDSEPGLSILLAAVEIDELTGDEP